MNTLVGQSQADLKLAYILGPDSTFGRYADNQQLAAAGSGQGDAAAITVKSDGLVSVSATDDTKGVILPIPDKDGYKVHIKNTVAAKILKVYPHVGAAINAIAANGALSFASGAIPATFIWDATLAKWFTLPLVPS